MGVKECGAGRFLTVGFTSSGEFPSPEREAADIAAFLTMNPEGAAPVDCMHLRKPDASDSYVVSLIKALPEGLLPRVVLHSHFHLFPRYNFGGIHKKEASLPWVRGARFVTRGCHSLEELENGEAADYAYSFLSPVFNSISKPGYNSAFSLEDKKLTGIIERMPVVALGGVRPEFFSKLFRLKFAGAALLGYLWSPKLSLEEKVKSLLEAKNNL